MKRLLHNGLALLMSSAVLAATLLPPPVYHSHAAGGRPHSHASEPSDTPKHEQLASDSHSHHDHAQGTATHHHRAAADEAVRSLAAAAGVEGAHPEAAHLHLSLIGLAFSLFLSGDRESDSSDLAHESTLLAVVLLDDDLISASRVKLIDAGGVATAVAGETVVTVSATSSLLIRGSDPLLLRDSARCEGSGVLLI